MALGRTLFQDARSGFARMRPGTDRVKRREGQAGPRSTRRRQAAHRERWRPLRGCCSRNQRSARPGNCGAKALRRVRGKPRGTDEACRRASHHAADDAASRASSIQTRPAADHPVPRAVPRAGVSAQAYATKPGYQRRASRLSQRCAYYLSSLRNLRQQLLDLALNYILRHVADDLIGHLAALEEQERRNPADAIARWRGAVLIHVDLGNLQLACVSRGHAFHDGGNRPAGTAPHRPKIDQHRYIALQHFLVKIRIIYFKNSYPSHVPPYRPRAVPS